MDPELLDKPKAHPEAGAASGFVVLTGNPNCGKTTLFNALTGLRAKVGNYAGVTVERKEGPLRGVPPRVQLTVLDLPGSYSLSPKSPDEQIARDVLFNRVVEVPSPEMVVLVLDASNLERNLYYATQVIELGYPTIVALNMVDVAEENGLTVHTRMLAEELGVPVIPTVANKGGGLAELRAKILEFHQALRPDLARETGACSSFLCGGGCCGKAPAGISGGTVGIPGGRMSGVHAANPILEALPKSFRHEVEAIAQVLSKCGVARPDGSGAEALALLAVSDPSFLLPNAAVRRPVPTEAAEAVAAARARLEQAGLDWAGLPIEARYARVAAIHASAVTATLAEGETTTDKIDRVLTHKVWGMLVFVAVMALMFQSIFWIAEYPMGWMEEGVNWVGSQVAAWMPEGDLRSLVVDGVIAGVGAVVVFLPQILMLFLFIGLLEDTGYMARAAFLMDRVMSKVGLHGKSFVPLLSSYACAIPGIMATRTIENPKDRLVTILVAPLMSCSARLPVYTVLIAASIPDIRFLGFLKLTGLTLLAMYFLGTGMALFMAWFFKKTLFRGEPPMLIMELPPYKRPVPAVILRHMWDRSKLFLRRAGTVILGASIVLWFLATHPRSGDAGEAAGGAQAAVAAAEVGGGIDEAEGGDGGEQLRNSYAGRLGRLIEPVIAPLGFDWKIGIGIVASFAAREVFVSTMSTVYNLGEFDESNEGTQKLAETLKSQTWPDGRKVYTPLVCVALMVFYVFAMQCVSTIAVVHRETNGWRWPAFQFAYMTALAWTFAFVTYQGGKALGF